MVNFALCVSYHNKKSIFKNRKHEPLALLPKAFVTSMYLLQSEWINHHTMGTPEANVNLVKKLCGCRQQVFVYIRYDSSDLSEVSKPLCFFSPVYCASVFTGRGGKEIVNDAASNFLPLLTQRLVEGRRNVTEALQAMLLSHLIPPRVRGTPQPHCLWVL